MLANMQRTFKVEGVVNGTLRLAVCVYFRTGKGRVFSIVALA